MTEIDIDKVALAIADDGTGMIYIMPEASEKTAVAIPARDTEMRWHKNHPEIYTELVERFNAFPAFLDGRKALTAEVARLTAALAETEALEDQHGAVITRLKDELAQSREYALALEQEMRDRATHAEAQEGGVE